MLNEEADLGGIVQQIAVVDIETTGLSPKSHRVVEIAIVVYDPVADRIVGEIETLINPNRNIPFEATEIHGLTPEHVSLAPTFDEISSWLAEMLDGKLVVAHNAQFDVSFLNAEFLRAGTDFQIDNSACTYRMTGLSLKGACLELDYVNTQPHSALGDARAALEIYRYNLGSRATPIGHGGAEVLATELSSTFPRTISRAQLGLSTLETRKTTFARFVPATGTDFEMAYFALLNEYLEDLQITEEESRDLSDFAETLGFSPADEIDLRSQYLARLAEAAMRDGVVTEGEQKELAKFADALGVSLTIEQTEIRTDLPPKGALICATGVAEINGVLWDKDRLQGLLQQHGYAFTDKLNKKDNVALLIQESESSMSGKVQKAITWGIPRMTIAQLLTRFDKEI